MSENINVEAERRGFAPMMVVLADVGASGAGVAPIKSRLYIDLRLECHFYVQVS